MLNEDMRRERYAYQRVANGGFDTALHDFEPTPRQRRRIKHKQLKAIGNAPRSRKQRFLEKLRKAIEEKRKSMTEAQTGVIDKVVESTPYPDEYPVVADKDGNPLDESSVGKPLCSKEGCEPQPPNWSCRTASGKKTKDHAGRVH